MRTTRLNRSVAHRIFVLAGACVLLSACGLFGRGGSTADGQKDLDAGKYRSAYIEATKVLRGNEKDGEAWLLLAKASLMLGNPHDAMGELQHAETNGVPRTERVLTLGEALLVSGQFDKLATEVVPDKGFPAATNARIDAIRGDAFRALKKPDDAKQAYQAALKIDSANARSLAGLARLAAASGDTAQAAKFVQQSLAALPDNPRALVTRGDLAFDRRDFVSAEVDFQKAVAAKTQEWMPQEAFYARARLADAQTRQDKLEQALGNVDTLEKMSPDQPYPHYLHAEILYKQNHLDGAISQLQMVLKNSPDDVPSQMLMGAISLAQGNYGQAQMYFSNVMGVQPENVAARRLLALAYFRAGNTKLATSTLRPTVTGDPSDTTLLGMLQQASTAGGHGTGDAMERQLALASQALSGGNDAEAVRLLEAAKAGGASAQAQRDTLLVLSYLKEHRLEDALKTASARVAANPGESAAHLLFGTTLVAAGKRDDARAQYQQALKLDPKSIPVLLSLGSLDAMDGRAKDAADQFNAVLAQQPANVDAMTALGKLAMSQNDASKAIDWFKRAIEAAPAAAAPRIELITLYSTSGKFDEAAASAQSWVAAAPHDAAAQNAFGVTELNAGHVKEALKSLGQAVQLAPTAAAYQVNLARAQIAGKDSAAAKTTLSKLISADPMQVQAVAMLAFLKLHDGDEKGALAEAKALQQQPVTRAAGFALEGDLYATTHAWDKAAPAYAQGLKLDFNRALVVKNFLAQLHSGAQSPETDLVAWLQKHPDDTGTRLMLAQYYLTGAQSGPAAEQYVQILKAHPADVTALNNLAWLYVETRNPQALSMAEHAYKLSPASPNVLDTYGWALIASDRSAQAVPLLARAVKAAPDVPTIRYHLAVAQARAGDQAGARLNLKILENMPGDFPERKAAEKLYIEVGGVASSAAPAG